MNKNIISIYPGHNANITFYSSAHNSYHIVEIEKLFGLKHARMETKHYVPFRDEYINPLEAIPKALELAKKYWGIENDFHTVINGTACPDRHFFHQQLNPEVIEYTLNTKNVVNGCPHHVAHAYCGWKQSPFASAYVITADGGGDDGVFNGFTIQSDGGIVKRWHSHANMGRNMNLLGSFIEDVALSTHNPLDIAGKVMGLSAYGNYNEDLKNELKLLINDNILNNEVIGYRGSRKVKRESFMALKFLKEVFPSVQPDLYYDIAVVERTKVLVEKETDSGHWWKTKTDPIKPGAIAHLKGQDGYDFAKNLQVAVEEIVCDKIREHYDKIEQYDNRLIFSGGVALNVLVNERIKREFPKIDLYVPPNPADGGLSFGTLAEYRLRNDGDRNRVDATYAGLPILDERNEYWTKHDFVTEKDIADRLKQGQIIGLIQGNSEIGPRALGNRSILCDPSITGMKDKLNAEVKFREWYRPFAPICKREDVDKYFMSGNYHHMQYMSFALEVKEQHKEKLAAITHVDNTARVQTVTKGQNKILYEILQHHGGVLLNTSFNVQGKPILNTIDEAFHILKNTGLDAFVYDGTRGLQLYEVK